MRIDRLNSENADEVMDLFCKCFVNDPYYVKQFPDCDREAIMRKAFYAGVVYCLNGGFCYGIEENGTLLGFILCIDYQATKHNDPVMFRQIFTGSRKEKDIPYEESLHQRVERLGRDTVYCISVGILPELQRRGLGACLVEYVLRKYPDRFYVSDVSNEKSLGIYRDRRFSEYALDEGYWLVTHDPEDPFSEVSFEGDIQLLVPDLSELSKLKDAGEIQYEVLKDRYAVAGCTTERSEGYSAFVADGEALSFGTLLSLDYNNLLKYQRAINVAHYDEIMRGRTLVYFQTKKYDGPLLMNDVLGEMIPNRSKEWGAVPDIFVSLPVQYRSRDALRCSEGPDQKTEFLLKRLDYRTHFEAGIPKSSEHIDDLSCFKQRLKRHYLGKLKLRIVSEPTEDNYEKLGAPIGAAAYADLYISVDEGSDCAVLTWFSLAAPFLTSHLMDNVIRNQLQVEEGGELINFYDYVSEKFMLTKRGTSKIYGVFANEKEYFSNSQLASLLAAETIYPDGELFGRIIDPEIVSVAASEVGIGQYDRAHMCAYTNVVLKFSPRGCSSLCDRLTEESITLFYLELILLEEAAIHIADREIISLATSDKITKPVEFLKRVDAVYDGYSKTIELWDIRVNYPTSQKSIDALRNAFRIKEQLTYMQRNQEQLQKVFETKREIIDRQNAKRMDSSLAIISVLAVFSAWIDGHDYIATWSDVFSPTAISVLQKVLFALVLIAAGYAVSHLLGRRFKLFSRDKRHDGKNDRDKHK